MLYPLLWLQVHCSLSFGIWDIALWKGGNLTVAMVTDVQWSRDVVDGMDSSSVTDTTYSFSLLKRKEKGKMEKISTQTDTVQF